MLVAVIIWLLQGHQREEADRRTAWSVVNSQGGGRREALEHLYHKGADLRGVYGEGGFFEGIDLHGANIVWAHLAKSDFYRSNLRDTNLIGADLTGADLYKANLTDTYLHRTNLTGAHLDFANLTGANLSRTTLTSAKLIFAFGLTQAQIDSADGNEQTKLPPGIHRPKRWKTPAENTHPTKQ